MFKSIIAVTALVVILMSSAHAQRSYNPLSGGIDIGGKNSKESPNGHVLPIAEMYFGGEATPEGFVDGTNEMVMSDNLAVIAINPNFYLRLRSDEASDGMNIAVDRSDEAQKFKRQVHVDYKDGQNLIGNAGKVAHDEGALGMASRHFLAEELPGEGKFPLRFVLKYKGGTQHWELDTAGVPILKGKGNTPEVANMAYINALAAYFTPASTFDMQKMAGPLGHNIYQAWSLWKAHDFNCGSSGVTAEEYVNSLQFLIYEGFFGSPGQVDPGYMFLAHLSSDPRNPQGSAIPATTSVETKIKAVHLKGSNRITVSVLQGQALVEGGGQTQTLSQGQSLSWKLGTGVTVNGHPDTYYLKER